MRDAEIDVERARLDTPGCKNVLHFNNAGASLMPRQVLAAVIGHLELEAEIGGYEAADQARNAVDHVYDSIARLIGAQTDEIAIAESATRAWDMAFYAIPFAPGDRILTSVAEYGSNYIAFLHTALRRGAIIEVIPNDEHGQTSIEALRRLIDERTRLIAVTHVPTNGGLVNPAEEIGEVAEDAGVLYLLDACQSVGQMPVDVSRIKCDMLTGTGRKYIRGPRGTGFLYVRRAILETLDPPFLDNHAATWVARDCFHIRPDARRFESWETNHATKIGLGIAAEYALSWGVESIWSRVSVLAALLRDQLQEISDVTVRDLGIRKCGIVAFTIDGHEPPAIRKILSEQGMNISVSTVNSTRLDMEGRGLASVVRASLHYYNTEQEINRFCNAIEVIVSS